MEAAFLVLSRTVIRGKRKGVMTDEQCINKMVLEEREMKRAGWRERVGNWWSDILQ